MKLSFRLTAIVMALVMILGLAACTKTPDPTSPAGSETPAASQQGNPTVAPTTPSHTEPPKEDELAKRYGGHANWRSSGTIQELDPMKATGIWLYMFTTCVFENVLTRDADNNIQPAVCDYELSDDTLTLKLILRDGIKFSNGDTVDIYDVEASLKRYFALYKSMVSNVTPLLADFRTDAANKTITLTFSEYSENILYYLAAWQPWGAVMPKEICEKYPDSNIPAENFADMIGTGPYMYTDYKQGEYVTLTRVPDYQPRMEDKDRTGFAGTKYAFLDSMTFIVHTGTGSAALGLFAGEYDCVEGLAADLRPQAEALNIKETVLPSNVGYMTYFNVDGSIVDGKPVNVTAKYPSLRKAIMAAIDFDGMLGVVSDNQQVLGGSPWLTPSLQTTNWADADWYGPTNMEAVQKYLAMAKEEGWDGEEKVQIVRKNDRTDIPTLWSGYMTAAGIPNEVTLLEPGAASAFIKAGAGNNFDIIFAWPTWSQTPTTQPKQFSTYWAADEKKNEYIEKMGKLPVDSEEYIKLAKEYDAYLVEQCGAVYMGVSNWYWYSPATMNFNDEGVNRYFFNAYWDDPENHPKK